MRAPSVDSIGSTVSRHDLLYMSGEEKRIRNIEAHYDPSQVLSSLDFSLALVEYLTQNWCA